MIKWQRNFLHSINICNFIGFKKNKIIQINTDTSNQVLGIFPKKNCRWEHPTCACEHKYLCVCVCVRVSVRTNRLIKFNTNTFAEYVSNVSMFNSMCRINIHIKRFTVREGERERWRENKLRRRKNHMVWKQNLNVARKYSILIFDQICPLAHRPGRFY